MICGNDMTLRLKGQNYGLFLKVFLLPCGTIFKYQPPVALKAFKPEKLLYTMGEVTEMFDVKPSLIRFWEERFDILRPKKNKKGNRLFTPADVKNLEIIYHLTKERGMTLSGVEKYLKSNREEAERETEIVRGLQTIRALLVEIREELREEPEGEVRVFTSAPDEVKSTEESESVDNAETVENTETAEEELEEITAVGFEEFAPESDVFVETLSTDELIDAEVSEPFTIQPLFLLDDAEDRLADEEAEETEEAPEKTQNAPVDTQQSLF
jgi:DNA-binding transcriptional MerR regulator